MGRKKNSTSTVDVGEKMRDPIARVLEDLIKDPKQLSIYLGCSLQAVNQYKKGIARPSLENLSKIADYYHVSTDYILGRTVISSVNPDIQAAAKCTGLSQKALEVLIAINNGMKERYFEKVALDHLIQSKYFLEFLHNLCLVENYSRKVNQTKEQRQHALNEHLSAKNLDEADAAFAKYQQTNKSVENMELFEFQAQKTLFKIFTEIEGGKQNGQYPEND